jgi:hypothetical protein
MAAGLQEELKECRRKCGEINDKLGNRIQVSCVASVFPTMTPLKTSYKGDRLAA